MNRNFENDYEIIQGLLGSNAKITKAIHGGNSQIFIVNIQNKRVVVKKYLGNEIRKNTSMNREVSALNFLCRNNAQVIPELLFINSEHSIIVMEYLQGFEPKPTRESIEAIIGFSKTLNSIYREDDSFPNSIDGIEKSSDLLAQIENRINSIKAGSCNGDFLLQVKACLNVLASRDYEDKVWDKTYSVSDLGVHNMIKCKEGIRFYDFEFFGADSPIKLIGDFLLHPRNHFSRKLRNRFAHELKTFFGVTESAIAEYLPLSALKWSMIVLRRRHVDNSSNSKISQSKTEQLAYTYMKMSQYNGAKLLQETVNSLK
jgi:hypothetical protein